MISAHTESVQYLACDNTETEQLENITLPTNLDIAENMAPHMIVAPHVEINPRENIREADDTEMAGNAPQIDGLHEVAERLRKIGDELDRDIIEKSLLFKTKPNLLANLDLVNLSKSLLFCGIPTKSLLLLHAAATVYMIKRG